MADWITLSTYSEIVPCTPYELPEGLTRASSAAFARPLVGRWQSVEAGSEDSAQDFKSVRYEFFPDGRFFTELETTSGEKHRAEGHYFEDATTLWFTVTGQAEAAKLYYSMGDDILTMRNDALDSFLMLKRVPSPHL